ncbi:hypothetical protein HELRODRAFT_174113 [Helobdella robusta]|uniref:Methyltransferase domain-containing protein n=1 Tax=Helobdella robusta TaxID=6412 RepID=T1F7M6_HELRO|nr:hypothetical protein HELRODRAFT_174113 [Helobdella robusta]ESO03214.1 hypothetical protein HELRODRAFT_174113 [Helobdella robusta]
MEKGVSYPTALRIFRDRHNEMKLFSSSLHELATNNSQFKEATTCLSIGTGCGEFDIEFIQKCLSKLKEFIAVEPNRDCAKELEANFKKHFHGNLTLEIFEMKVENFVDLFEKSDDDDNNYVSKENIHDIAAKKKMDLLNGKIDVFIAFHVIYFLNSGDRSRLYDTCFNRWLDPINGQLVFANAHGDNAIVGLMEQLGAAPFLTSETIKQELKINGVQIVKELTYRGLIDLDGYSIDHLNGMFHFTLKNWKLNSEKVSNAIKAVASNGYGSFVCELCVC